MKIAKKSLTPIKKNGPFTPDTFQKLANPHISDSWEDDDDDDDDDDDEEESLGRHLQNKITIITSPVLRSKRLSAKKSAGNSNKKKPQQQELLVADKEVIDLTDAFEKILVQDEDEPEEKEEEVSDKAPRKATPFKVKSSYMSSIIPHTPIRSTGKTIGFADLTDDGNDDVKPVVKQEEKEDDPNLGLCDARDDNGDTVRRSRRNNKHTSV